MSRRSPARYERYFTCPFCAREWSGRRMVQQRGLGRRFKPMSEQAEDVQADHARAVQDREQHIAEKHGAEILATRMGEIEREAKWATDYATSQGEELDWATHPLAVEWRALMKAWWALPPQSEKVASLSPTYGRSLISKGMLAPPTAGERHMSKVASHQRKLRLAQSQAA